MTTITVITPWHDHPEFADGYWEAIEAGRPDDVIIIDNGSTPPLDYPGIRFEHNTGFSAACNSGLEIANTDAVLFLNNDVELTHRDWLDRIRKRLGRRRLVGPLVRSLHTRIDGVWYPYIDGWCLAGMRDDLVELGGWDETLAEPSYYGDNLLSLRAQQAGFTLVDTGYAGLRHIQNGTSRNNLITVNQAAALNRAVWEQAVRDSHLAATPT